ncbi:hypothetical protein FNO01nite_15980 [Flavobacterium noncentrifugens]|uniref:IPT/TIG domain-containing protein n=1 Tax=Flavobacterium noncentrifugens TaxID=1128970 RepID=A0A1G8WIV5_9FLAO|nr:IPT/TIG domain-containing protein [Flavobacterium noncentrifugens]GEP50926.1 hypothetical protein FNO01nite_15980 [Flavobacterium noncentrifugens]SDJ77490.1 hypothetical protein SAMN04487935_1815 [Flavobacterium noncentrifugens]
MKSLKISGIGILLLLLSFLSLNSCSDDDSKTNVGAPPVISSVSASTVDDNGNPTALTPVNLGYANNYYIISGSGFTSVQKVYFNETDTYFNPAFVTDNTIIVNIDIDTPYADASDELKVVTANGTAVYHFVIAPPAPLVNSFNPINAAAGETVTVYGDFFLDPVVTVGTTAATVISSTMTEIQFVMPADSNYDYVEVTTISGSNTAPQAIGTAIYDDARASFVENWLGPWDGSGFTVNTSIKIQGESSIEANYTAYTGFKIPMFASPVSTAPYSGIRISLKSTKPAGKVKIYVNGNNGAGKEIEFTSNWTSVVIPFADLGGAPASLNEIVIQEFANAGGDKLFFDDIGFILR